MPKKYKKTAKKKPLQKVQKKDTLQTDKCTKGSKCYPQSDNLKVLESITKEKKIKESDIFDMSTKKKVSRFN
jgi:hypothetical protein